MVVNQGDVYWVALKEPVGFEFFLLPSRVHARPRQEHSNNACPLGCFSGEIKVLCSAKK
jgi:hypothetical protein